MRLVLQPFVPHPPKKRHLGRDFSMKAVHPTLNSALHFVRDHFVNVPEATAPQKMRVSQSLKDNGAEETDQDSVGLHKSHSQQEGQAEARARPPVLKAKPRRPSPVLHPPNMRSAGEYLDEAFTNQH